MNTQRYCFVNIFIQNQFGHPKNKKKIPDSLVKEASILINFKSTRSCFVNNNWHDVMFLFLINIDTTLFFV